MQLYQLIDLERIIIPLKSRERHEAFKELVAVMPQELDQAFILEQLWDREQKMTTGIGFEVAIPHAYIDTVDELVICVGIQPSGIDFQSIDYQPVKLIFMNLAPKNKPELHRNYLQYLSQLLYKTDQRHLLMSSLCPEDFLECLELVENRT